MHSFNQSLSSQKQQQQYSTYPSPLTHKKKKNQARTKKKKNVESQPQIYRYIKHLSSSLFFRSWQIGSRNTTSYTRSHNNRQVLPPLADITHKRATTTYVTKKNTSPLAATPNGRKKIRKQVSTQFIMHVPHHEYARHILHCISALYCCTY